MSENTETGSLVERLRDRAESYRMGGLSSEHTAAILDEAASALASERAAHAETKRELADLKNEWEAEYETRIQYQTRLRGTEARLAEALKALEPFARNVELIHPGAQDHDRLCDYGSQFNGTPTVGQARAARHVREGGKVDG